MILKMSALQVILYFVWLFHLASRVCLPINLVMLLIDSKKSLSTFPGILAVVVRDLFYNQPVRRKYMQSRFLFGLFSFSCHLEKWF